MRSSTHLLLAIFITLFASGCDDLTDIDFKLDGAEVTFTVSENDGPTTVTITEQNIATNLQTELDENNVDSERVKAIKPTTVTVTIPEGAAVDFSLIDRATLSLNTAARTPIQFSDADLTAVTGKSATLEVSDVELLPYLEESTVDYVLSLTTNAEVPEDFDVKVQVTFTVTGTVL